MKTLFENFSFNSPKFPTLSTVKKSEDIKCFFDIFQGDSLPEE